jgi:hypothetical protein
MNDADKLAMLQVMVGENNESLLNVYLNIAKQKILDRAYPYDDTKTEVPNKYAILQCEIAAYLYNKRGAEGQTSHDENGIKRTYENADVPESMLKQITPHIGVIK